MEVHIHHLRRKLGNGFIRTIHGVGYTLGMRREASQPAAAPLILIFKACWRC